MSVDAAHAEGGGGFFRIQGVRFLDGGLVVADQGSEELRAFTSEGLSKWAVGGMGRGPGQFVGLDWISVWRDTVLAHGNRNGRFSVWDADGRLDRTFRLDGPGGLVAPVAVLEDGSLVVVRAEGMIGDAPAGTSVQRASLERYDRDGSFINALGDVPYSYRVISRSPGLQTTIRLPVYADAAFAAWGRGLCYAFGSAYAVTCIDATGVDAGSWQTASPPRPLTEAIANRLWAHEVDRAIETSNQPRVSALRRTREEVVFPEYLPAFTDLLSDGSGRLWARVHSLPWEAPEHWWVFEDGVQVALVEAPPDVAIMDVGPSTVATVWRDSLEVEHVRVYRIER